MDIIVVGAGIAGLSAVRDLVGQSHVRSLRILEASDRVGGRIHTMYNEAGKPLYDSGAWRLPESHSRILRLCRELGLELSLVQSETSQAAHGWLGPEHECKRRTAPSSPYGAAAETLSDWDDLAAENGICTADLETAKTGYAGMDIMANGTDAYGVHELQRPARFFVPSDGLSKICETLAVDLRHRGVSVELQTQVIEVVREESKYRLVARVRTGKNEFCSVIRKADILILAVPPHCLAEFSGIKEPLAPILASLQSVSLTKIFTEAGSEVQKLLGLQQSSFHFKSNTLTQQLLSNTYPDTTLLQLAYSAGRRAEALERMRLGGELQNLLVTEYTELFGLCEARRRAFRAALTSKPLHVHYWRNAVHVWLPSYDLDMERKSHEACVLPHLLRLPNLYLCGEAVSTVQGWSEGALRTSKAVTRAVRTTLDYYGTHGEMPPAMRVPRLLQVQNGRVVRYLVYDGRIVDVGTWFKVHPGSAAAILQHLGEDVTELFKAMAHPRYVLGFIFALQVGWQLQ